jgi:hypothetical protein
MKKNNWMAGLMCTFGLDFNSGASVSLTCWAFCQRMVVGNPNKGARVTVLTNQNYKWMVI